MRVLMLTSNDYTGRYWQDMAIGFSKRPDAELGFASFGMENPPFWHESFLHSHIVFGLKRKTNMLQWVRFVLQIRNFKPDVIQSHLFYGGLFGIVIGKLLCVPVVFTRHHLDEHFQNGTRIHRLLDKLTLQLSHRVITCSQATKDWIVENEAVSSEKVKVVYQGFDYSRIRADELRVIQIKNDLFKSSEKFKILCVSRFSKVKGQTYLLDALSMNSALMDKCEVNFIGIGDSKWLETEINLRNLSGNCKVLGASNEVLEYMKAHDLIVHPSLADSFSQTVIEAMALGKCVVAANTAAVPEQIENFKTGFIVPQRDSFSLANVIQFLEADRELIERIGKEASRAVQANFSLEFMITKQFLELKFVAQSYRL